MRFLTKASRSAVLALVLVAVPVICLGQGLGSSSISDDKPSGEIYGFAMSDAGYNAGSIDPQWFDVMRPTKLPAFKNQFGEDGSVYFGTRQTRFGTKFWMPTDKHDVRGIFEWELFGTGADAGQTTFRLRHAYLQYGKFGAGQYWSSFMDIGVFPNTVEYWGPVGMVFYRNIQVRYMPVMQDQHNVSISLEKPGASADEGGYNQIIEQRGLKLRYPLPDLAAHYKFSGSKGYFKIAGILRNIEWDDLSTVNDGEDYSDRLLGWGLNASANIVAGPGTLRANVVYGEGIQNYMNDSTSDIVVIPNPNETDPANPTLPPAGAKLLPILGTTLFYDWNWNERWTSSLGFSTQDLDLKDTASAPSAFAKGRYAIANVSWLPAPSLMTALEVQYGRRENHEDGWDYDAVKVQFSAKYSFNFTLGG